MEGKVIMFEVDKSAFGAQTRDLPLKTECAIRHYDRTGFTDRVDVVVTEYALTIYVNDQEMATVVCSPEHMDDFVIGFLASEGVIRSVDQVKGINIHLHSGTVRVKTTSSVNFNQTFYNKRYIASCCGKSRQMFYFYNDVHTAKRTEDKVKITPDQIFFLIDAMQENAQLFQETGGAHIASLCTAEEVLVSRTDIGRHNALDKLYGYALHHDLSLAGKIVTFSGRLSSEILLKVAKIGVGVVLAKSAPTALALDIAEEMNITTVGFVREGSFNVYTHPWRVLTPER